MKLFHDVPNLGIRVFWEDKKIIYITDTKTVKGIFAKDYDLYFIEGNYNEDEILERIKHKEELGIFVNEYRTMETHLSIEEATEWLIENMGENSIYELIHMHVDKRKGVKQ